MKKSTVFVCNECGFQTTKWMGKCPECNMWNTLVEEVVVETKKSNAKIIKSDLKSVNINEIKREDNERIKTKICELDRVLGGGLVKGSLVLVGGEPGIGKSTLLLQITKDLGEKVLYISGEESLSQIKMRAERLKINSKNLSLLCETNFDGCISVIENDSPQVVIVDSIQTMYLDELTSAAGSVSQVREVTLRIMQYAKKTQTAFFIVGHVTKDGSIAGPRVLEHMVDCVLYFEGDRQHSYRILRAVKNRFGSTNEIGVFEMGDEGLIEIPNPSLMLLSGRPENAQGSCITCAIEGSRAILSEIQALTSPTGFGVPRRMATGIDYNRMTMLLAVLEKRVGISMQNQDSYINVVGGLKIDEPAADLAVILAVSSSAKGFVIPKDTCAFGEVGLTGEIRAVSYAQKRIMEAKSLGFTNVIIPYQNAQKLGGIEGINIISVKTVGEALSNFAN